jgi:short-subunit dehydrogenase
LHLDLKQFNIAVTTICPGFVETPLTDSNRHSMPFIMKAPRAAELIVRAIKKKKMIYAFPFIFAAIVRLISMLPRTWYRFIMTRKTFNYSKE